MTMPRPMPQPMPLGPAGFAPAPQRRPVLPEEPCFIVGAERSGTTMLRLMLDGHPGLTVLSEFEYVVDPLVDRPGTPDAPLPAADVLQQHLTHDWIFREHHRFAIDPHLDYRNQAHAFLHQQRCRSGKPHPQVLAMVHRNIDQLPRLWPWARYVHLVRDPRDVARSCVQMGWNGNTYHAVRRWLHVERQWNQLKAVLPADRYLEVRQEQLVLEPRQQLQRVCAFLGLAWHDGLLSYQHHSTYEAPNPNLVQQWRRKMTPREIGLIEGRVGPLLAERGYEPSGHPVEQPGPLRRWLLKADDRARRARQRLRHLGLPLWVADTASRYLVRYLGGHFGLEAWRRRVEPRVLANRLQRLK